MTKKILALLLCTVILTSIVLAGCGGGDGGTSSGSDSTSGNTGNAGNVATLLTTALGDKSFDDSCWRGLNEI